MQSPYAVEALSLSKSVVSNDTTIPILTNLNLAVPKGERLAIIGSSGSGKSTLLGLLAGLDIASSGKVVIAGKDMGQMDEDGRAAVRAEHMGFVFQSFQLLGSLTALENVMLPMQLAGQRDARAIAIDALESVGLASRATHYPKQLSGGEQQRVAIARAFAAKPSILFADEPTGNLDVATGEAIIKLLFDLNAQSGTTLVLVTHDMNLARRCQRVLNLQNGQLKEIVLNERPVADSSGVH